MIDSMPGLMACVRLGLSDLFGDSLLVLLDQIISSIKCNNVYFVRF